MNQSTWEAYRQSREGSRVTCSALRWGRAIALLCLPVCGIAQQPVTWTTKPVVLESEVASWARMSQLSDGSWLAAYTVFTKPSRIRVKRSTDNMRTWQFVTEIVESGRDLDN